MSKTRYTKMQQAAIDIRNKNILVSAAAGSGKTAVLVQRIINRVLDPNNPIDIDRILVMTFTRAAAAQMKERILSAINEMRSLNPHDKNLNKQYALVHNAYIMTIDSFCMNVVRNHFEEIGLSPDFRMADEGEITLMMNDVLSEVLEDFYENGDDEFLKMTEIFAAKKSDLAIEELVKSLYGYAESYPDPIEWLGSCVAEDSKNKYPWLEIYVNYARSELNHLRQILDDAGDICSQERGPIAYLQAIEADIVKVDRVLNFETYEELYVNCAQAVEESFEKLARVVMPKGEDVSEAEILERTALKARVQEIRDKYKKTFSEITELVASMSPENIDTGMKMMKEPVSQLIKLTVAFCEAFDSKKRDLNVVDFSDIEHMCLQILRKGCDDSSSTAATYRDFFEEIYVDEYQDSNFVQEEILNLISKSYVRESETNCEDTEACKTPDIGNVFMVGDVKQSIYGFRNAKPEIFIDKYERFTRCPDDVEIEKQSSDGEGDTEYIYNPSAVESRDVCVNLSHNFRSRAEVLDSVNSVFKEIMTKRLGGIEYDEAAALHKGREFVDTGCDYTTEMNLFVSEPGVSGKEAEALMIANRIKELMNTMVIEDSDADGGKRPLKYSDIVILLRTAKGWDNVFTDVLESQGIPVFVTASTGYFETIEVKTLLNFLKIIDNPLQDIPFAAVMMSVIGNFTEEEVAIVRASYADGYLYEAFMNYYETYVCHTGDGEKDDGLAYKVDKLRALLQYYRIKCEYTAVSDIITEIIDGDYGMLVKAMPGGKKKFANLNMLLKKAIEYGNTSYKGIFQFNRYIEAIQKYQIDYGEANISDDSDDTVRIMSIHKSKGLEFPVCFVSGINKAFNMMDVHSTVLTDGKYGIATDVIDIEKRVKSKSLFKISIAKKKQAEIIAEELRLLYVAMTRAKEKLILTGSVKSEDAIKNSLVILENASSYLDMLSCAAKEGEIDNIITSYKTAEDLVDNLVEETIDNELTKERLLKVISCGCKSVVGKMDEATGERDNEANGSGKICDAKNEADTDESGSENEAGCIDEEIKKRLQFEYPYKEKKSVIIGVTELIKLGNKDVPEEEEFLYNIEYLYDEDRLIEDVVSSDEIDLKEAETLVKKKGKQNDGQLRGSAIHRILELWDYSRPATEEAVREHIAYVIEEMLIKEEYIDHIDANIIYETLNSDIAMRMKKAAEKGLLFREQRFIMRDDEDDPDSMLVRGTIDAYFIEDDKIVLVDYKTNQVKKAEELISKYEKQLYHYGRALTRMIGKELKESIIYSTVLKECISI